MLNCPFCEKKWGTPQLLSMHVQRTHTSDWKGSLAQSIPSGFDIGKADVRVRDKWRAGVAAAMAIVGNEERAKIQRARQNAWYANLTPEQKKLRIERQRLQREGKSRFVSYYSTLTPEQKKARQARNLERNRANSKYGCPYCAFGSNSHKGFSRHMTNNHPGQTGLVEMRPNKRTQPSIVEGTEQKENNTDKALVDRIVDAVATMIYRDMKGKE